MVMDREAWCAAVYGLAKSWTWLSNWKTTKSITSFANIFSHSVGCLFVLLWVSFAVQKLVCLNKSYLFIFVFISIILGGRSKKLFLRFVSENLPLFSSRSFIVFGLTFRSWIQFQLIFVCKEWFNLIFKRVAVQFFQHIVEETIFPTLCSLAPFVINSLYRDLFLGFLSRLSFISFFSPGEIISCFGFKLWKVVNLFMHWSLCFFKKSLKLIFLIYVLLLLDIPWSIFMSLRMFLIIYFLSHQRKEFWLRENIWNTPLIFFLFCHNVPEFYYKMCFLLFHALDKGKDQHPFNNMDRQGYPLKHSQGCQSGISLHPDFFRVLIPNCPRTWKQLF